MSIDRGKVADGADKSRPALHVPCWLRDLAKITAVDMKEGKKKIATGILVKATLPDDRGCILGAFCRVT